MLEYVLVGDWHSMQANNNNFMMYNLCRMARVILFYFIFYNNHCLALSDLHPCFIIQTHFTTLPSKLMQNTLQNSH